MHKPILTCSSLVVARCEIALQPGERSKLHCSEHVACDVRVIKRRETRFNRHARLE